MKSSIAEFVPIENDKIIDQLNEDASFFSKKLQKIDNEIKSVIVGQEDSITKLILALIINGHVLLEGVPGLAKTLMVRTLSDVIGADFSRIQFTPDLLPADILGTKIFDPSTQSFSIKKGPIFHNFILADEINRAPPKVQSALLEVMQEKQATLHGETFVLDKPFIVFATENPIESEGTYRLPEAQLDRFAFKIILDYPSTEQEKIIIQRNTTQEVPTVKKVIEKKEILEMQDFVKKIYCDEKIQEYIVRIIDATRLPEKYNIEYENAIEYGSSPRASIWLVLAAKANALLNKRGYVVPEDVRKVSYEILRHRISISYEGEAQELTSDDIIKKILATVETP